MAKAPIASTLFRFVTTRNPQLLSKEERERGFVYFPTAEKGNSHFLDQLENEVDDESRITYLNNRTATFNNLTTRQIVENVNSDLYDFSHWLMKNKNIVTSEEAAAKATGVTQLTTAQLVNLWDNLFYQVVSKKSDAVREAIIQMIVADNFLKKDDSQTTKSLITDDIDLQRLANAYVVITKDVATNHLTQSNTQRSASRKDYNYLDQQLTAFEAAVKVEAYETAVEEIKEAININRSENSAAYSLAYATYEEELASAYSNATKSTDPDTGYATYTGLVLPDFSFSRNSILAEGYLDDKASPATLSIVSELTKAGIDDEISLVERLEEEASQLSAQVEEGVLNNSKTVLYNGTLITVSKHNVPEFTFSASAQTSLKDSSQMILALNLATGYEAVEVTSNTLSLLFDTEVTESNVLLQVENATTQTAVLTSYPEVISIPPNAKSFKLLGSFTLDNGEELEIEANLEIDQNRTYGSASRKTAPANDVEHHGVKKVGVADFRKVDQEVCCYVPGEVSRIENILAKEYKERATRSLLSSETTSETTTEKEVENLTDTSTSERNELASEVSSILTSDESKDYGASAGVNGTFGGPTSSISFGADAFYNGASSSSSSNSNSSSQTYAEEVTTRALERVVQKVTKKRTSRILREFEENNKHGFDNREGTSHVTGVYRWVDKIYNNKLINYGKRLIYEFDVPEPSKFFKDAIWETIDGQTPTQIESLPADLVLPAKPRPLPPQMKDARAIKWNNYQYWGARYNAEVKHPPMWEVKVAKAFSGGEFAEANGSRQFSFNDLEVPEGHYAYKATWTFDFRPASNGNVDAKLIIGNVEYPIVKSEGVTGNLASPSSDEFDLPHIGAGAIPVSVVGWDLGSFVVNVTIHCHPTSETVNNWKNETYNAIVEAYQERVNEYNDSLFATFVPDLPSAVDEKSKLEFNPLLNRALEKRELKRLAIQMLAKPFGILTAKNNYRGGSNTNINLNSAFEKHAQYIKFFEQCFDWEIMAYSFYPYFYAQMDKWKELFRQSNGTDHIFQAFLQSSMARMVVPVRPGFEEAVTYFLETGDIWMGNQLAIESDDDLYLSIAEELQSTEGVVEKEWETRVPTALTIVQSDSAPLTENGLPCCHNEDSTENLAYGTSIMVGKDETPSV
ncbi:MAG: hypothetical protein AAF489_09555 [Bacteroidota bacterium]